MARLIEFTIMVDVRNMAEFLDVIYPIRKKQGIHVQGIHGIMSVFNVNYAKARDLAQGVLRPSIYRDGKGYIRMNLNKALDLFTKEQQ